MTHTNEFLRGMFAAYMGCEVMVYETKATILSISLNSLYLDGEGDTANVDFEFCKPILTPLSEITDNDAVEVAKLYYSNKDSHTIELGRVLIDHITTSHMARKVVWSIYDASAIIDYLRSPYRPDGTPKPVYDCGYMGVSQLIEAGLAISSITTK